MDRISPSRDHYLGAALPLIPKLLQLLDRDPTRRTYGCFDRQYWHFRTMDFPSGMSQEFCLPLALVWKHDFPGSTWKDEPRLKEWVLASVDFARRSAHKDASCDDYYPYERALGAVVFSLYAMSEALRIVGCDDPERRAFLVERADWTLANDESGVLTNHHAIAAAALQSVGQLTGEQRFLDGAREKAREVLGHQHEEGWYREYEGFDPGYQTVTIDFLARYWKASGDDTVLPSLERAVRLLERVQLPDGLFGGEYAARNTWHTQPHGFEILAERMPAAARVADRYLMALAAGLRACNDDDRLLAHHVYPCLLAWLDHAVRTEETPAAPPAERTTWNACGFHVDRREDRFLVTGLSKGAPFRAYRGKTPVANDSGPTLALEDGTVLVAHLSLDRSFEVREDEVSVSGAFQPAKTELMTPVKGVVLRGVMLSFGRWFRTAVRKLLQRRLILGAEDAPFRFERRIRAKDDHWVVTDRITRTGSGGPRVKAAWLGVGQTSIYIAASQPWERGWLLPWTDLADRIHELDADGILIERKIGAPE